MHARTQASSPTWPSILALTGILAALFLVGTLWDLRISEVFHDQSNLFGILGAAFGELPAGLALVIAGTMLVLARNREHRGAAVGQIVGGVVLLLLGALMVVMMPGRYLDLNMAVLVIIGLVAVAGAVWLARWLTTEADRRVVVRTALVLFLVVLAEMILVNVVKVVWERPRLRFLAENPEALFQPWYVIGNDTKDAWLAKGIESEEFKSFPSGHAANAAALMLLVILAPLKRAWAKHETLLLWVGAVWCLLIAFSRIVVGAHFVSDTVAGISITLAMVVVAMRVLRTRRESVPALEKAVA